jgi:signal transduction histidine kinase
VSDIKEVAKRIGLGLAIAQQIVEETHGGQLFVTPKSSLVTSVNL